MTWRDETKKPATFRGVPFYVSGSEHSGGRRGVTHKYPFRNESFREDIGRETRTFSVEGFVLGEGYFAARDALLTELEKEGPGELVHPYHGRRRVAALTWRVRESAADGGMATFTIEFEETPAQAVQPASVVDAAAKSAASVTAAKAAVSSEFLSKYSPGVHMDTVSEALRKGALAINKQLSKISQATQKAALARKRLDDFVTAAETLARQPENLLAGVVELFSFLESGPGLVSVSKFDAGTRPTATTANSLQEQTNFDQAQGLFQRLALLGAVSAVVATEFETFDEAVAAQTEIADLLDEQAELASDETFAALATVRADLVRAVPDDASDLARLVPHTPIVTLPSLVVAHRLYGDTALEQDIVTRNGVKNPGFVAGGAALKVLSRG